MPTMYVNVGAGQTVNVRSTKSKSTSNVIATIGHGNAVTVQGAYESGGGYNWWPITYNGSTRYIERISTTQFLSDTNPNSGGGSGTTRSGYVITSQFWGSVNLRSAANSSSTSLGTLKRTSPITYIDTLIAGSGSSIGWYQVTASKLGSGYIAADYVAQGSLIDNPSPIITDNRSLTIDEQITNAQYIYSKLRAAGWTATAACGAIGNMETESKMSPGAWEGFVTPSTTSKGFGLVQWTPSTKYLNWNITAGYTDTSIEGQIERIKYEVANPSLQWNSNTPRSIAGASILSFPSFTQSALSARDLGRYWVACYEKPQAWINGSDAVKAQIENTRGDQANTWYSRLV